MVDPSPQQVRGGQKPRKEGIRCGGTIKGGPKAGQKCTGLILGKDDLSAVCHNCGDPHHLLALLGETIDEGYLTPEQILEAVPSLRQKRQERRMITKKGRVYFAKKFCELFTDVFNEVKDRKDYMTSTVLSGSTIDINFEDRRFAINCAGNTSSAWRGDSIRLEGKLTGNSMTIVRDSGIAPILQVRVKNPKCMTRAKRFARRLETLTKRIQEEPTKVQVIQDF